MDEVGRLSTTGVWCHAFAGKKSERQEKLLSEAGASYRSRALRLAHPHATTDCLQLIEEQTTQWANGIFLLAEESDTEAEALPCVPRFGPCKLAKLTDAAQDEILQVKKADMEVRSLILVSLCCRLSVGIHCKDLQQNMPHQLDESKSYEVQEARCGVVGV